MHLLEVLGDIIDCVRLSGRWMCRADRHQTICFPLFHNLWHANEKKTALKSTNLFLFFFILFFCFVRNKMNCSEKQKSGQSYTVCLCFVERADFVIGDLLQNITLYKLRFLNFYRFRLAPCDFSTHPLPQTIAPWCETVRKVTYSFIGGATVRLCSTTMKWKKKKNKQVAMWFASDT